MKETIKGIPLTELHPFPDHPFGVRDDEAMEQTVESIKEYQIKAELAAEQVQA